MLRCSIATLARWFLLFVLACPGGVAAERVIHDLTASAREEGQPAAVKETFLAPDLEGIFTLVVQNGDPETGGNRATSALILLNGEVVVSPEDFKKVVINGRVVVLPHPVPAGPAFTRYRVALESTNTIKVTVTGAPDSFFSMKIVGNKPPIANAGASQTLSSGDMVQLDGTGSSDADGDALTFRWRILSLPAGSTAALSDPTVVNPSFEVDLPGMYVIQLMVNDGQVDSLPDSVSIAVDESSVILPPDPIEEAPELDLTVATTLDVASKHLYTGDNPVQTGVEPGTIDPVRVAVLRGKVTARDGVPLSGVTITVFDHPELGQTLSRADGLFDLAVNGGGLLTIVYEKTNYLTAHRQHHVSWQGYTWVPEVVLIRLDSTVTSVDLTAPGGKVARGSLQTDADGPRQATVLFSEGTEAELVLEDGTTQVLTSLNVRATEYTVGADGPKRMPAQLPPSSAYTYAFELSADEAIAANDAEIQFDEPVYVYLENFLGFSVGGAVPTGYYDRANGQWVPSENGRVVEILSVTGELADLDTDGDGLADDETTLAALEIADAERAQLAALYTEGQTLWRVPITHFSPYDCNWPYGLPDPAPPPPAGGGPITGGGGGPGPGPGEGCTATGSIIDCHNQLLGEYLPLVGVPFGMYYQSDRVPGHRTAYTLTIPLIGEEIPEDLLYIDRTVSVAGNPADEPPYYAKFSPSPNLTDTFEWDGTDFAGRTPQGPQAVSVYVCYGYQAKYYETPAERTRSFGGAACPSCQVSRAKREAAGGVIELCRPWEEYFGTWDARAIGLGGWTLEPHHTYIPASRMLYRGDGRLRDAGAVGPVIQTIAGSLVSNDQIPDGGAPATEVRIQCTRGISIGPDGSYYISDPCGFERSNSIHRVDDQGTIITVAGGNGAGFSGDGGRAVDAQLKHPVGIAVGPDGGLYIADRDNNRIRLVTPDGIISTFAGNGTAGIDGDGGPATEAALYYPIDVDVGPDGTVYIVGYDANRVRAVSPDGTIRTVAGFGEPGNSSGACDPRVPKDGGPATEECIRDTRGISVGSDGSLYIAQKTVVRRVAVDGIITRIAGINRSPGYSGDGGPATEAQIRMERGDVFMDDDGTLYIADGSSNVIRAVGPDGIIRTLAGTGIRGTGGDGGPAAAADLDDIRVAVGPDGLLYIADDTSELGRGRIRRLEPPFPGVALTDHFLPSTSGTELYRFDQEGRHLETLDTLTGIQLYEFGYDADGRLESIRDRDGNQTTIEHDPSGTEVAIVGPFGQRTELTLNGDGYLRDVTNPAGESHAFTYHQGGLLATSVDPNGGVHDFGYDESGRLERDEDPAGGVTTLDRIELESGYEVTLTTGLGRVTKYRAEAQPTGTRSWINTFPDGTQSQTLIETDGSQTLTTPDGTVTSLVFGPDPRFGMLAPVTTSATLTTPGGLNFAIEASQMAELNNPEDPLSLRTLTSTASIGNRTTTSVYDAATRTLTTTTPAERQSVTTLDATGRLVGARVADLEPFTVSYDDRGRPGTLTTGTGDLARSTALEYDLDTGYLDNVTDSLEEVWSYEPDEAGRVETLTPPDQHSIGFTYDDNSNLETITPPGQPLHRFTYTETDALERYSPPVVEGVAMPFVFSYTDDGDLDVITRADSSTIDLDYDETTGNLSTITWPGSVGTTTFDYDESEPLTGQLESITAPDGESLAFGYDGALPEDVTWAGTLAGIVTRDYDSELRVSQMTVQVGNDRRSWDYLYDEDEDADGLLTSAGDLRITYRPENGLLRGTTLGAVTTAQAYTRFGELESLSATFDTRGLYEAVFLEFDDLGRKHDDLGRIVRVQETVQGVTEMRRYVYDQAERLHQVYVGEVLYAEYTYDANGNRTRTQYPQTGLDIDATYDEQDRIETWGDDVTYTFDNNGSLLSRSGPEGTTRYTYDAQNALRMVMLSDGRRIDYAIDPVGRRVGKSVDGVFERGWLYQDGLNPVAELDASGNIRAVFIYSTRSHVPDYMVTVADEQTYRLISDVRGSVRLVVNASTGAVVQELDYDPWGRVTDSNPRFQPFGYAGGLYDPDTGLVRFGARDYDAETGRWTARDPILFEGGQEDLYVYVWNDPINLIDPSGLANWMWYFNHVFVPAGTFLVGMGDAVSMGLGRTLRNAVGGGRYINECSSTYIGGVVAGEIVNVFLPQPSGGGLFMKMASKGGQGAFRTPGLTLAAAEKGVKVARKAYEKAQRAVNREMVRSQSGALYSRWAELSRRTEARDRLKTAYNNAVDLLRSLGHPDPGSVK